MADEKEPTFSVQVCAKAWPHVVVAVDKDGCWLEINTFARGDGGLSGLTIHLPDDPDGLRAFAQQLLAAADEIAPVVLLAERAKP